VESVAEYWHVVSSTLVGGSDDFAAGDADDDDDVADVAVDADRARDGGCCRHTRKCSNSDMCPPGFECCCDCESRKRGTVSQHTTL
jgi:hypothetical protein